MDRWLINAPRWLLVAALVYAPWAYGSTRPEAGALLAWILAATTLVWGAVCVLRRATPAVPPVALICVFALAGLGWFMVGNARYDYEGLSHQFIPRTQWIPGATGSLHRAFSLDAVLHVCAMFGGFCVVCDMARFVEWRKRLLLTVALTGTSIATLGLLQKLTGATAIFWGSEDMGRTFFATYRYHANAGAFLNLAWPVVAGFVVLTFLHRAERWEKGLWVTALVLCLAGVLVNTSRASGALGILLVMIWFAWAGWQVAHGQLPGVSPGVAAVTALLLLLLIGSVAALAGLDGSLHRWSRFGAEVSEQNPRLLATQVCLGMVPQAGWLGFGPGTFSTTFPYFTERFGNQMRGVWLDAHQDYLQTVIEWGYLGAVVWAVLVFGGIGYSLRRAFRHRSSISASARVTHLALLLALFSVLLHAFFDFPLQIPSIQLYVATFLGLLWGSRAWLRPPRPGHLRRHHGDSHRPQRAARPAASAPTVSV